MGKMSLSLVALGVAACGSDNNNPADAKVVIVPDAKMIDAPKVFNDAPPVNYDFTCFGMAAPTTAADPVTIAGSVQTLNGQTPTPVDGAAVATFKVGNATAVDNQVSAADGSFTTGNIATGAVPVDGYIKASKATFRTTYLYPPSKIVANLTNVPVPMISTQTFGGLVALLTSGAVTQDDNNNGVFLIAVTDCALMPITGATLSVKQASAEVGNQYDLGDLIAAAAGTFVVLNVPDGDATVTASYNSMTFPAHVVRAYKQNTANSVPASITSTAVRPGP